jgi:hypothetical protein
VKQRIASSAALLLLGFLGCLLAGAAVAQQPSQAQASAIRQSCRSDYQSHCSGVPTGGMASLQCLQGHISELSPACQTAVGSASGGVSDRPPASGAQTSAPGSQAPGNPASGNPPRSPSSNGGPPSMPPREKLAIMRRSCGGDFRAYCRGVAMGGGEAMRCLADNQSRLSPACRDVMAEAHGAH